MKRIKKILSVLLAMSLVMGTTGMVTFGASSKKITSVSLVIKSNIKLGDEIGSDDIEITSSSSKFSVDSYEVENDGFEWTDSDVPKIKVYLAADEGYYFSITSSNIKLNGGKYVAATKQDSSRTLVITMTLPALSEQVNEVDGISLNANGTASWNAAIGAGSYEVRLVRDGSNVGNAKTVSATSYDFSSSLTKAGNYSVRVRGINKTRPDNKSEWTDSGTVYINSEAAGRFKESSAGGGWKSDDTGWWYQNNDGSYVVSEWKTIDGIWYYFNDKGYMAVGWVQWNGKWYYCNPDGSMLMNGTAPDGSVVGADGAYIG